MSRPSHALSAAAPLPTRITSAMHNREGFALKVSDEFTVPLCAIHHSENHATGDERRWWQERKIDPLTVAAELWRKSRPRETDQRASG